MDRPALAAFKETATALLSPQKDAKTCLMELVTWLDHRLAATPHDSLETQLFVRALIAMGRLFDETSTVEHTLEVAASYAAEPSDAHYGALQAAATNSYPFGPGDGCLAVHEIGFAGCALGSGCRSGSGTLVLGFTPSIGHAAVARAIREDLTAWLATLG
jgi:hypothetical protein